MRKYTAAPKDLADALRDSIPVSEADALGEGWKKLPVSAGTRLKAGKKISARAAAAMPLSTKKVATGADIRAKSAAGEIRIKSDTVEVSFGGVRFKAHGTPSASYGKALAKAVKDYIKAHPVKS
jgi:hypothetical protein